MKKLLPFLILILTTVVMSQTSQVVLDSAGRKIMIKPDGTWEYVLEKVEKAEINKSIIADDLSTLAPFLEKNKKYLEKSEF